MQRTCRAGAPELFRADSASVAGRRAWVWLVSLCTVRVRLSLSSQLLRRYDAPADMTENGEAAWFLSRQDEVFGPYSSSAIIQAIGNGELLDCDLICREGTTLWVEVGSVVLFAPMFAKTAPERQVNTVDAQMPAPSTAPRTVVAAAPVSRRSWQTVGVVWLAASALVVGVVGVLVGTRDRSTQEAVARRDSGVAHLQANHAVPSLPEVSDAGGANSDRERVGPGLLAGGDSAWSTQSAALVVDECPAALWSVLPTVLPGRDAFDRQLSDRSRAATQRALRAQSFIVQLPDRVLGEYDFQRSGFVIDLALPTATSCRAPAGNWLTERGGALVDVDEVLLVWSSPRLALTRIEGGIGEDWFPISLSPRYVRSEELRVQPFHWEASAKVFVSVPVDQARAFRQRFATNLTVQLLVRFSAGRFDAPRTVAYASVAEHAFFRVLHVGAGAVAVGTIARVQVNFEDTVVLDRPWGGLDGRLR